MTGSPDVKHTNFCDEKVRRFFDTAKLTSSKRKMASTRTLYSCPSCFSLGPSLFLRLSSHLCVFSLMLTERDKKIRIQTLFLNHIWTSKPRPHGYWSFFFFCSLFPCVFFSFNVVSFGQHMVVDNAYFSSDSSTLIFQCRNPVVTGAGIVAAKYRDGVMIMSDTLGCSYFVLLKSIDFFSFSIVWQSRSISLCQQSSSCWRPHIGCCLWRFERFPSCEAISE